MSDSDGTSFRSTRSTSDDPGKLSPFHLEHLYRTLLKRGGRKGQPLSAETARRVHQMIQKALTASPSRAAAASCPVINAGRRRLPPGWRTRTTSTFIAVICHSGSLA